MKIYDVTSDTFQKEVKEYDGTVLLDFFSEGCSPCKKLSPIIEEVADEAKPETKICKINVDNEKILTEKFGIMSIPTLIVMKNGEIINRSIGITKKSAIIDMLEESN